jgi:SAM-dependent methyltransferase
MIVANNKSCIDYGKTILNEMSLSPGFSNWSVELARTGLEGRILEIGCGLGGNLDCLSSCGEDLWCSDYNEEYISFVSSSKNFMLGKTILWDINDAPKFSTGFDSFYCSNVLEHIEDDQQAILNISRVPHIKKGVIIVPSNKLIYNRIDKNLGHYRRYNKRSLRNKLVKGGFKVISIKSFNKVGAIGWFVQGFLLKMNTLGGGNMKLYNKLLPLIKLIDKYVPIPGLSIMAVVERTS